MLRSFDRMHAEVLYRVNFEVNNLEPFPYLAFPDSTNRKIGRKRSSFDGEFDLNSKNLYAKNGVESAALECSRARMLRKLESRDQICEARDFGSV